MVGKQEAKPVCGWVRVTRGVETGENNSASLGAVEGAGMGKSFRNIVLTTECRMNWCRNTRF